MKINHLGRFIILVWIIASAFTAHATISILSYWHLGESDPGAVSGGAATSLYDSAGRENLTVEGNATYTNDVSASAAARTASSLSVVFTNGALASGPGFSAVDNFGIECWVKPGADVNAGQVIAYNGSTATSGAGILLANGQFQALFGGVVVFGAGTATPNVWTHVALVRDSGNATLYVNGVPSGSAPNLPNSPLGGNFAIAAPPQVPFGSGQSLTGRVDEVRVFLFAPGTFSTNDLLYFQTNYVFGTTNIVEGPGGGTDSVVLSVPPGRSWSATLGAPWLDILAQSGTDSTNLIFAVAANPGPTRTGTISVGAQSVTITQAGSTYVAAGPLTNLVPASAGLYFPTTCGVDAMGNFYVVDGTSSGVVHKWTKASNATTTLITSGLSFPFGIAVDYPGNVFLIDGGNNLVRKWTAIDSNITTIVSSGLNGPTRGAADAAGNLYFSDTDNNAIKKWTATNGNVSPVVSSGVSQPYDLAVDAAGNVYFYDLGNFAIKKWTAANNTTTTVVANVTNIDGVAVDNGGNVYFSDRQNNAVKRWQAAGGDTFTVIGAGITAPAGLFVDDARNIYTVENVFNGRVLEQPRAFVNTATHFENSAAGTDAVQFVLPASVNLLPPFAPTSSDTSWLNIVGVNNGVITISFTANAGATRTANITVLGQTIPVTQQKTITPPVIKGVSLLSNTVVQFSFTNNQSTQFTVLSSTNVALPLSDWTVLGAPSNMGAGLFQFTTQPVTNDHQRFYRIRSP